MNYQKDLSHLIGQKFGRLLVLSISDRKIFKSIPTGVNMVLCQCDCGNIKKYTLSLIKGGHTKSCGCFNKEQISKTHFKHGFANKSPVYRLWKSIKRRCYNELCKDYKDYGGRGILVCEEWKNDFEPFYNWCIENGYKESLQIDRIRNDGNYEPSNCRFVTNTMNARNRRSNCNIEYKGETKTFTEWCEILNLNYRTIKQRVNSGWDINKAFEFPIRKILFLITFIVPLFSFSQLSSSIGYGYDLNGRAVAAWSVGATIWQIVEVQGEVRPSLSRNIFAHNYCGINLGLHLINPDENDQSIILGAGYYTDLKTQFKNVHNKQYIGTFVKCILMLNDNGGLFGSAMYINNHAQFLVGIHYKFTRKERLY